MNKPTASGLDRAMRCGASLHLPQVHSSSSAAERGTARHLFLARVGQVGAEAALAEVPEEHRDACAALPLNDLPTNLAAEETLALNVATGEARVVGHMLDRNYGELGPMEIVGTADALGVDGRRVHIVDWKSQGYRERAENSAQMRFLALAAMRAYGADVVRVEIIRLGDDGQVRRDWHEYDAIELGEFGDGLREWFAKAGANMAPSMGAWCQHCKSMPYCGAQSRLAIELAEGHVMGDPLTMLPLSPERAGVAYTRIKAARSLLAHIERAVMAALDEAGGTLPLPNGRSLVKQLTPGNERLDGQAAATLLAEMFGAGAVAECAEVKVTKTSLGAGLRKIHGRDGAARERAFLKALRDAGGVSRKPSERLVEVDAKGGEA